MGEVRTNNDHVYVKTNDNAIEVSELQLEGKKTLDVKKFLIGYPNFVGSKLE